MLRLPGLVGITNRGFGARVRVGGLRGQLAVLRTVHTSLPLKLNHQDRTNHQQRSWKIGVGIGLGLGLSASFAGVVHNDSLVPDPTQETFELGLFKASQDEKERRIQDEREANRRKFLVGVLYRVRYWIQDYVVEPLVTVVRLLELAGLFVPIFALYPIVIFGKRNKQGETTGALVWYRLVRLAAELAGASFIKLGQWAASRTDIFSRGLCDELSTLHSDARAHSYGHTQRTLAAAFGGRSVEDVFEAFEPVPVGCGAIAQVYVARLSEKVGPELAGKRVAVKVVHPNIERKIERDLRIMRFFAAVVDCLPTMEWLSLPQEVEQFSLLMKLQLDLRIEGHNLEKFQQNFAAGGDVRFPTPYLELSSREVLVEEHMNGLAMNRVLSLRENFGKNLSREISDTLIDTFLRMLILDNFIHADLHPGNIIVRFVQRDKRSKVILGDEATIDELMDRLRRVDNDTELMAEFAKLHDEGFHPQICLIDTGLVTELGETDRYNFISLFNALSQFDGYTAGTLMIERSKTPGTAIHKELFKIKVERLVNRVKQRTFTLGSISIGDLLDQMLGMVRSHHVRMDGDFITVIVAILLMEGIGRQLDPDLDLFARSLPILRKLSFQDGKLILKNSDKLSMLKVWVTLEARQFVNASVQDVYRLVKSDGLCPNY